MMNRLFLTDPPLPDLRQFRRTVARSILPPRRRSWICNATVVVCLGVALLGCATFEPLPLPTEPDLLPSITALPNNGRDSPAAAGPLNRDLAALLAVRRNPDLKAARLQLPESLAQAYAATLYPDPQVNVTADKPLTGGAGLTTALLLGAAYDIRTLIVRGPAIDAAKLAALQTALDLDWRTWQVAQQARGLYIQLYYTREKLATLEDQVAVFRRDYERQNRLLKSGDVTLDSFSAALIGLSDGVDQLLAARRLEIDLHDRLAALIGIEPFEKLELSSLGAPKAARSAEIEAALARLPDSRPDLLALRASYKSQDARLRGAILGQFPSVSIGFNRARDTAGLDTVGFGLTFNLPIFDRNRGAIAIETATRARLNAEFQARLDTSYSDVYALHRRIDLLIGEIGRLDRTTTALANAVSEARAAYLDGDFPSLTYTTMRSSLFTRRVALTDRRQAAWQAINALDTLLGGWEPSPAALRLAESTAQ